MSGGVREAMHHGRPGLPWTVSAELDGQAEEWLPWTGLPLRDAVAPLQGSDDPLAGAGATGPLGTASVGSDPVHGFGGQEVWVVQANPLATDTPTTRLQFWRGAVNAYRFGFGLSRQVLGPWSVDLRMNTRSAPGRFWEYRQQVNDMFGPRGKPQGLPFQGHGPGQDDVRWESVVSRKLDGGRLDLGWNWVDAQRGVPDPLSTWDSLRPKSEAYSSHSGMFGRLELERPSWSLTAAGRQESQQWRLPSWTDTGAVGIAAGEGTVSAGSATLGFGPGDRRLSAEGSYEARDGTARVVRDLGVFDGDVGETRLRGGASGVLGLGSFELASGAGWSRLETIEGRDLSGIDARASLRWGSDAAFLRGGWSRSVALPGFERTLMPDGFRPRLDATGLGAETRDLVELRGFLDFGPVSTELGGAVAEVGDAIRPLELPSIDAPAATTRDLALRSRNRADPVRGFSLEAALHGAWRMLDGATRLGFGRTGLPGQALGGKADLSEPQWRSRTSLRWSSELLPGRFRATSTLAFSTWSGSRIYVPAGTNQAILVDLDPSWNLDLENRCEIRTFEIFWRIENLGDRKQAVLPGWTPLGIRSGWGVVWNFGG